MHQFANKKGLTLPELLIAAAVLAVAFLGVAGMFPTAYQNVSKGGRITKASILTQQKMEELKNRSYASLTVSGSDTADPANLIEGLYTRTWRIEDNSVDASIPANMKRITVTVTWSESASPIQLRTLLAP